MRIIKQRERVESTSYSRAFDYEGENGWGYAFDCDKDGNVDVNAFQPDARKKYAECLQGFITSRHCGQYVIGRDADGETIHMLVPGSGYLVKVKMVDRGVRTYHHTYNAPAIGECSCGAHVDLDSFTNTCHGCGRDYNRSGQLLAPAVAVGRGDGRIGG